MAIINWQKQIFIKMVCGPFCRIYPKVFSSLLFVYILLIPFAGHAQRTITIDIARMFPNRLLDLEVVDAKEERTAEAYIFTKRYGGPCPQACVLINLAEDARPRKEYISRDWWESSVHKEAPRIRRIDGFPVGLYGNIPGLELSAGFRFMYFQCYIQAYGEYATFEYIDEAVRNILEDLEGIW